MKPKRVIQAQVQPVVIFKYPCTSCGGDAEIGMSDVIGPRGQIVGKKERLCMNCYKKRDGSISFIVSIRWLSTLWRLS
jgi:hypothetical protein